MFRSYLPVNPVTPASNGSCPEKSDTESAETPIDPLNAGVAVRSYLRPCTQTLRPLASSTPPMSTVAVAGFVASVASSNEKPVPSTWKLVAVALMIGNSGEVRSIDPAESVKGDTAAGS